MFYQDKEGKPLKVNDMVLFQWNYLTKDIGKITKLFTFCKKSYCVVKVKTYGEISESTKNVTKLSNEEVIVYILKI